MTIPGGSYLDFQRSMGYNLGRTGTINGQEVGFVGSSQPSSVVSLPPAAVAAVTGVNPTETSYSLYGHIVPLSVLGRGRIGGEIISGPWVESGLASFIISFGFPADPSGTRILKEIAFDSQVVWQGSQSGAATLGPSSGFLTEAFTVRFYDGKLTQAADSLETSHFGAEACAYRPQMLLVFENLPLANTKFKKIPYVAAVFEDASGTDVNYGEAFERIAYSPWVGLTSAQFVTSGITDGLPDGGLIIADSSDFLSLLQSEGRFYPTWDILQTDKLRVVDRGSSVTPDIILDATRLVGDVTINRQGQDGRRKDIELSTIDPGADYSIVPFATNRPRNPIAVTGSIGRDSAYLPNIMDASTRAAVATLANYYEDNTRKSIGCTAMAYGLEIEPGDYVRVRGLAEDFNGETFKVKETSHGANYTVEITAVPILKCAIEADDAGASFVSASDTRYDISATMNQVIPACAVGDMLIAAVMHRSALTTLAGWTLVDSVSAAWSGGTHSLSLFSRVAQLGDSGSTITWTQASSVRIGVHIQAYHSTVRTLVVVAHATAHVDNTSATGIDTAVASATGDGQIGVAFASSALASGLATTGLVQTMDATAHQTTLADNANNRLCGGYALLDLSETTAGHVAADYNPTSGGGWAAVSLVLG